MKIWYTDIGHSHTTDESWALLHDEDNLLIGSGDDFHQKYYTKSDYTGRIDHHRNKISIASSRFTQDRLEYIIKLLQMDYPNYSIWIFDESTHFIKALEQPSYCEQT